MAWVFYCLLNDTRMVLCWKPGVSIVPLLLYLKLQHSLLIACVRGSTFFHVSKLCATERNEQDCHYLVPQKLGRPFLDVIKALDQ